MAHSCALLRITVHIAAHHHLTFVVRFAMFEYLNQLNPLVNPGTNDTDDSYIYTYLFIYLFIYLLLIILNYLFTRGNPEHIEDLDFGIII